MSNWGEEFAEGDGGVPMPGNAVKVWNAIQDATTSGTAPPELQRRDPADICGLILGKSIAIANNKDNPVEARNMALANALNALKYAVELADQQEG